MPTSRPAALRFIFITVLIDVIGFGIIIPVLPGLIRELLDADLSTAATYGGFMLFAYATMQFIFSPVLGNLSDRYGRRPVLLFSLFGFGIDYIFMAFAPTIGWLFIGRVIAGITGASMTTAAAYVADLSEPEKRAQNFGMIGAAFGLGFILGPALGGQLGQYGLRVPFIGAAVLSLLNWLYGYFILPESLPQKDRRPFDWKRANPVGSLMQFKRYPAIVGLIVALVLVYIAAHAVQTTWSYYSMEKFEWNEAWVGYSIAFIGLMIAIVQGGLIRVIIPKLGKQRSVYVGLMLYSIGMVLFAFATKGWMMFAFAVPYCLGGIAGPALQGIISTNVPPNEQGELQGGLTSLMSATSIVGPLIMTNLFAYFTQDGAPLIFPGAPFIMGSVLMLISAALAYRNMRKNMKHPAKEPSEIEVPA